MLDCSNAFDTCKFSILFNKLLDTGLPPIVVRTLMFVYEEQYAWVRWGKTQSDRFPIINGTRQGSMVSPALWSVYLDLLIKELRQLGVGCYVGGGWHVEHSDFICFIFDSKFCLDWRNEGGLQNAHI